MTGFGEILVFLLYALLGSSAAICMIMTVFSRRARPRLLYLVGFIGSTAILLLYYNYKAASDRASEQEYIGTYSLTDYPGCPACQLDLKENNSFEVRSGARVVEKGDWRYESGGDYWIVYMNNGDDQLGNGRFVYKKQRNRQSRPTETRSQTMPDTSLVVINEGDYAVSIEGQTKRADTEQQLREILQDYKTNDTLYIVVRDAHSTKIEKALDILHALRISRYKVVVTEDYFRLPY